MITANFSLKHLMNRAGYILISSILLLGLSSPAIAFADTTTPSTTTTTTTTNTCPSNTGTVKPTGASAGTYTFNSKTCLWQNSYYTWNALTGVYTPITPLVYTYDPTTGQWNSTQWVYDPVSNKYVDVPFSVVQPPAGADTIGGPTPLVVLNTNASSNSTPSSNSSSNESNSSTNQTSNTTQPNNSSSSINSSINNNANLNDQSNVAVNNTLGLNSTSGDATVLENTNAGNAQSGNANTMSTLINSIASASPLSGATEFTANITGNVQGNLTFDPTELFQPASSNAVLNSNTTNKITVNQANNGSITNNLTLNSQSGDATVADNNTAGSADSGNANSVANVVNMINTMISSKQSFVGVINILGDLNGNILVPQQFLNGLIESNAPRSNYTVNNNELSNTTLNSTNNQVINNNVNAGAKSGSAEITGNTNAGNATTGNATTDVTIFNLAGDNVNAANSMLIFVNVLGTWVGMILNAPSGTTSALLGENASTTNNNTSNTVTMNNNSDQTITNNINLKSNSGNTLVSQNTNAGNAQSGNATASANIANLEGDNLSLTGWFGILFINVFGKWIGSLGIYNPLAIASSSVTTKSTNNSSTGSSGSELSKALPSLFISHNVAFTPISPVGNNSGQQSSTNSTNNSSQAKTNLAGVVTLTSATKQLNNSKTTASTSSPKALTSSLDTKLLAGGAVIVGIGLFGLDFFIRRKNTIK